MLRLACVRSGAGWLSGRQSPGRLLIQVSSLSWRSSCAGSDHTFPSLQLRSNRLLRRSSQRERAAALHLPEKSRRFRRTCAPIDYVDPEEPPEAVNVQAGYGTKGQGEDTGKDTEGEVQSMLPMHGRHAEYK